MNPTATEFAIENPAWLAALALLPLLWFYFRRSLTRLSPGRQIASLAVRCLLVVLVVAALAGPKLRLASRQVFLAGVYETGPGVGTQGAEQIEAFRRELSQRADAADFAEVFFPEEPGRGAVDPAAAILAARAKVPADRVPRIVLLSAGNATAGDTLGAAAAAGCPIDVVPLPQPEHEVFVAAVEAPGAVRYGEAFFVDVVVQSMHADEGRLAFHVDGALLEEREVAVAPGANRFRFRQVSGGATADGTAGDRRAATDSPNSMANEASAEVDASTAATSGPVSRQRVSDSSPWVRLSARIDGFRDTLPENNAAGALVAVRPKARVLLVDPQPELAERLREALQSDGRFEVEPAGPEAIPAQLAPLLQYDLLILSNVPATEISDDRMAAMDAYVRQHGGGLIVVGGNRAFTAGDYGRTQLEAMLPVEGYVRPDKPKPSLAMLLVLDRSGSMKGTPIELARQAVRQAVDRLGPDDQAGILAFEDRVHWVVPLQPFADKAYVMDRIGTIVAGGGTNIYPALDQAYLALRDAETDLRHIILLSDGVSHPADFEALVQQIAEAGITMSTVGVGDEASAEFLRDLAKRASGQSYFCTDPTDMPRIFELDVMAAGKHGITETPFRPDVARPARMLAGFDPSGAPPLLGYVDTRAKPGSQLLLTAPSGDPVLAWWRYGRGVSVAFTSDVHSRWAAAWHRWPGFARFWTSLARHAMRADPTDRFTVGVARQADRLHLTLDAVDAEGRWVNSAEVAVRVVFPDGAEQQLVCELVEPGRYAATIPCESSGEYRVQFTANPPGEPAHTVRRGFTIDYPEELRIKPTNTELLGQIAERTGGLYEPTMADLSRPAKTSVPRTVRLWSWLLAAAIVLFVVDVALKRPAGQRRA